MKFSPFGKEYDFSSAPLTESFPNYLAGPISRWIHDYLVDRALVYSSVYQDSRISQVYLDSMQLIFRRVFAFSEKDFYIDLFSNPILTTNVLAFMVENCFDSRPAVALENLLKTGGSAYRIEITKIKIDENSTRTECRLMRRVPEIVEEASRKALNANDLLMEAWHVYYKHSPDYNGTVSKCNDFMEGYLTKEFWPSEPRTRSIFSIVQELTKNPDKLDFKGAGFLKDKTRLIALLEGISKIRGEHTSGEGRKPSPEEAEYILHTTIYIWNLMEK
jgi:hypothetical protein